MSIRPAIIGPFGPPQLACIRSWKSRGFEPVFIHLSSQEGSQSLKRYVGNYYHLKPGKLNDAAEIARLSAFLSSTNTTGITCVADSTAGWLHSIKERLPQQLQYWIQSTVVIKKLESKAFQLELAKKAGFNDWKNRST